jgi:hypothetical protein
VNNVRITFPVLPIAQDLPDHYFCSETARHEQPDGILRGRTDDGLTAFAFRPAGKARVTRAP